MNQMLIQEEIDDLRSLVDERLCRIIAESNLQNDLLLKYVIRVAELECRVAELEQRLGRI
jgi:hypothetical protein